MSAQVYSLWEATARPAPSLPVLEGDTSCDVLIIGGGFTGMTAALALAEAGTNVMLIEQEQPGFGASGRNGGQVIPGLKYDPVDIDRIYGAATTDFAGKTADFCLDLIAKYNIACDAEKTGWIQASIKEKHLPTAASRVEQWAARGGDVALLDQAGMAQKTGSPRFKGGWIDKRAGRLHPLNYARGLAEVLVEKGVKFYASTKAESMTRKGTDWVVTTSGGATVTTSELVIATNGYSGKLLPKLAASVVPARSFQVATKPLTDAQLKVIMPEGSPVSETRRVGHYFRIGPENRLMLGGRGTFKTEFTPDDFDGMVKSLYWMYPEIDGIEIDYMWSGQLAMTEDHLPHMHRPFDNLTIALGYNGRGVALASALGHALGSHLADRNKPLPLKFTDIKPLPVHGLHPFYATLAIWYYKMRDALES